MRLRPILLLVFTALFGDSAFAADPPRWGVPPNELVPKVTFAAAQAAGLDWGTTFIKSPEAWAQNPLSKGKGVRIAVLDTGCDVKHPAVQGRIKGTYNAITKTADVNDAQGHGTHVADTTGHVAPESDLFIVKVLGDDGSGSVVDIAHGIDYAVTTFKVDVISMSLGGPAPDQWSQAAIKRATDAGVIVIAAAGNDGPSANTEGYPGRYPEVISVAAHDRNAMVANFSSRGPNVFSCLPGVDITAAWPNNRQSTISGTSMATPHQSGACASWIATHPEIPKSGRIAAFRRELQNALSHPASKTAASGYGSLDLTKLVPVSNPPKPPEPPTPPTPVGAVQITLADLTPDAVLRLNAAGIGSLSVSVTPLTKPADVVPPTVPVPKPTPVSMPTYAAPPGDGWKWDGANWRRDYVPEPVAMPQAVPQAMPLGLPLIRQQFQQTYQRCFGPNCPK